MTPMDRVFVAFAALQLVSVGLIAWVGFRMLETIKRAQARVQPAMREVRALAGTGKALAEHAKRDGTSTITRVHGLLDRLHARVAHTRRVLEALKPAGKETFTALRSTAGDVAGTAERIGDVAQRLSRLKTAAEAAAQAARRGEV